MTDRPDPTRVVREWEWPFVDPVGRECAAQIAAQLRYEQAGGHSIDSVIIDDPVGRRCEECGTAWRDAQCRQCGNRTWEYGEALALLGHSIDSVIIDDPAGRPVKPWRRRHRARLLLDWYRATRAARARQ